MDREYDISNVMTIFNPDIMRIQVPNLMLLSQQLNGINEHFMNLYGQTSYVDILEVMGGKPARHSFSSGAITVAVVTSTAWWDLI